MKTQRDHVVPLSRQAAYVVRQLRKLAGDSSFIFPATTADGCMTETACLEGFDRWGYTSRTAAAGLRAVASTAFNDHGVKGGLIGGRLAHTDGDPASAERTSAEWLSHRRHMAQWWADHLNLLLVESDTVAPLALAS